MISPGKILCCCAVGVALAWSGPALSAAAPRQVIKVALDDLEENPSQYLGKSLSVEAQVEEVFGPRLFTIDEPNWGDLDGEILVFMPGALAALVAEDDKITISGTLRPFMKAELQREWGWLDPRPEIEAEFAVRPVLVAERLIGANGDLVLKITAPPAPGTSGSSSETPPYAETGRAPVVVSIAEAVSASEVSVGRGVDLNNVRVAEIEQGGGFWISDPQGNRAFVLPQDHRGTKVSAGQQISLRGVLLEMPTGMRDRLNAAKDSKADLYVFATSIKR